jgi:hypothetical protein
MKEVEFKILPVKAIWIFLSIMLIFNGCFWFLSHLDRLGIFNISYPVVAIAAGIFFLSGRSEIDKISLRIRDKSILINWNGWIRRKEIKFDDIRGIYLRKSEVVIIRPGLKVLKLHIDNLEVSQKKDIYDFFMELSKEESLILERQFNL